MAASATQFEDITLEYTRPPLYPKQHAAIFDPRRYSVIEATTKAGKAQPLDALVYTPTGPKRMGDIRPGMRVLTPSGTASVCAVHDQEGDRDVYRVTFSDGSVTECDAEHLWEVWEFAKPRPRSRTVTTADLMKWKPARLRRTWVPAIAAASFRSRPVPLCPWLLGALIGDGTLGGESLTFSSADQEILDRVARLLPIGHALRHNGGYDWRITTGSSAAQLREDGKHLGGMLRKLGLRTGSHEKHIPDCYRYNTVECRMDVLRGLLDTDGFVDKHGQPGIEQTSERLARDIEEIVRSLGGSTLTRFRAVNGYRAQDGRFVQCRPVWRQIIRMPNAADLFTLERKWSLCRPKRKTGHRMFRTIKFARRAPTRCIELRDARQLYLTDGFIPTHNTAGCIIWITEQALSGRPGWNYWWVAPVSVQAEIAFRRCLRALPRDMAQANISLKTITLLNGAVIWFKSGDKPNSLYGDDVYAAVIDEASRFKEEAYHAVRSTLTATRGPIRVIGNVKGRRNWFFHLARRAQAGESPELGYHKITAIDAVAANVLNADEIEDARRNLPDRVFRELYLAEPSDDGGNPFGFAAIRACVKPLSKRPPVVWGWDLAKSVDWTVGIGLDAFGDCCRFERFQLPWNATMERISALTGRTPALIDSTGVGDPVVELLQKRPGSKVEGFKFTAPSKQMLMEGLAVAIQSQKISFPDGKACPMIHELEQFEYEYTRTGVRYSAPEGFHDDCVIALGLASYHAMHASRPMKVTQEMVDAVRMHGLRNRTNGRQL